MLKRQVTIKDIARELNISIATVSRALRNSPEINPETKQTVLNLAKKLDYHPNLIASSLSSKKSKTIGVLVPTINRQFWSNTIAGIEDTAYKAGYKVMIYQSNDHYKKELANIEALSCNMIDGLLVALSKETNNYDHFEYFVNSGLPLIFFERICEQYPVTKVISKDFIGAYEITDHLIKTGGKRIAHITGSPKLLVCQNRIKGYKKALKDNGLTQEDNLIIESDFTKEAARAKTLELLNLEHPPDSIFAFADVLAVGALLGVEEAGLKVPDDVAIAGFGNDEITGLIKPSITTMEQPSFKIGQTTAELLLNQIESDNKNFEPKTITMDTKLIIRDSTRKL